MRHKVEPAGTCDPGDDKYLKGWQAGVNGKPRLSGNLAINLRRGPDWFSGWADGYAAHNAAAERHRIMRERAWHRTALLAG